MEELIEKLQSFCYRKGFEIETVVDDVEWILDQYQKVICECTNGLLSKLNKEVISYEEIPTLFERVYSEHKIVDVLPNITKGCEDAFLYGDATIKMDGSCCAIINGEFYKRYDAKKGKPIPKGAIKCQEEADPITGHLPCWVKCDINNPSDKWFWVAYRNAKNDVENLVDGTYEAIGKHFQGNPYNYNDDFLVKHGTSIAVVEDRTFDGIKKWVEHTNQEGLVFWYKGEPVCKIKRTDFGLEWPEKE